MKISKMEVTLVDHCGSDLSVVNAARVSMHKESVWANDSDGWIEGKLQDKDVKLINYLAKHNHWSPFGHAFLSFRIKAPIFVARQAGKHQVGLVWNEVSRRYVDEEPEFWFPDEWRGRAENVKQGSSGAIETLPGEFVSYSPAQNIASFALDTYTGMMKDGVAPELARIVLPQNTMTEWIWSGSLAAFSRVCKLRLDPHSQKEIQELAGAIAGLVEPLFPVSWKALMEN